MLPKVLSHADCKYYPTGLLAVASYLMHEAHFIQDPGNSDLEHGMKRWYGESNAPDSEKHTGCCGDSENRLMHWQAFDAAVTEYWAKKRSKRTSVTVSVDALSTPASAPAFTAFAISRSQKMDDMR